MSEERAGFPQARAQLEQIVSQVRRKDVPLEKCLELLEEGVRLANECTELSDQTEWRAVNEERDAAEGADTTTSVDAADASPASQKREDVEVPGEGDGADPSAEADPLSQDPAQAAARRDGRSDAGPSTAA